MENSQWYKEAIVYELNVRAFFDSNKDGIGDFNGVIHKLDYLSDLGINCIWLLPIFPSPGKDDGYDVSDFYSVNNDYGTLDEFKNLISEAHKREIRVIIDVVVNHTSDQHSWFKEAVNDINSKYYNYYVWSDSPDKYNNVRIIFSDTETSNWTYCKNNDKYYWHRFYQHQPDLNYDNPSVQEEMENIIRYWIKLGVDGFRIDAAAYLFERENTSCENLDETHQFFKKIRRMIDNEYPGKVLLAEVNQWPQDLISYFGNGDEFHMAFNFPLMPRMFMAIRQEKSLPIVDILKDLPPIPLNCQWAMFLRNHDELTLEMCTDEEKDYLYTAYKLDKRMILNTGIRRRLAPLMENDRKQIELLYAILLFLPGSPVLYYGDEIGMGDNVYLGDRNGVRTPMQWNDNKNAGFSEAIPSKLYAPVILDPEYNYMAINVEYQKNNKRSLYSWIKSLINTRKQFKEIATGNLVFIKSDNPSILSYLNISGKDIFLCVFNLSQKTQPVKLSLLEYREYIIIEILSNIAFPDITGDQYFLTPNPYGYYIFKLTTKDL